MVLNPSVVALVPLRGGSKSIPMKNIKPLAGKPMCAWALEAALGAPCIDKVYVSTDSAAIADTVRALDPHIGIIDRPAEFAQDTSSTEAVMLHFADLVPFDYLFTIQATSPLTQSGDFQSAFERLRAEGRDSLLTGTRTKRFFWTFGGKPLNYDPLHRPRRQDFDGVLQENGAFYITRRGILEKHRCRLGGKIGVYEMDESHAIEIDEPADWDILENLLARRPSKSSAGQA
jgi:CMP-N-acetylneuraminic acid synthetase